MTNFTGSSGNNTADARNGTLVGFTGGTVADLQDDASDQFFGSENVDIVFASNAGARMVGRGGADQLHGGSGSDTFNVGRDDLVAGDIIDGSGGSDGLLVQLGQVAGIADFTVGVTITSIERLVFLTGDNASSTAKFLANQFGGTGIALNLSMGGNSFAGTDILQILMGNQTTLDLSDFDFDSNFNPDDSANFNSADHVEVVGDSSPETITGTSKGDVLLGNGGNDTLDGKGGADSLVGGPGNDIYIVDNADDSVVEALNEGTDEIRTARASFNLNILPNVENLTHTGRAAFTGIGNASANVLIGGTGNDYLIGLDGNDTLIDGNGLNTLQGGKGDDIYAVQSNDDTVFEFANEGTDQVQTFLASYTLAANVENLTFIGASPHVGKGNTLGNLMIGAGGDDVLLGGEGAANTLQGGAGNDTYGVEAAGDVVVELANEGTDTVQTPLSTFVLAANVENLTHTGSANFTGIGNAGKNVLIGGSGNDYLIGLDDDDTLIDGSGLNTLQGGKGNDIYAVQSNDDTVFEFSNEGFDEVQTFLASYVLSPNVEKLVFIGATAHSGTGNGLANVFKGGSGNDTFKGGGGVDRYDYTSTSGNGADTITDFDPNTLSDSHDLINLSGRGLSFEQLSLTATNGGTLVGIPGGDSIFLQNVLVRLVDSSDFSF